MNTTTHTVKVADKVLSEKRALYREVRAGRKVIDFGLYQEIAVDLGWLCDLKIVEIYQAFSALPGIDTRELMTEIRDRL